MRRIRCGDRRCDILMIVTEAVMIRLLKTSGSSCLSSASRLPKERICMKVPRLCPFALLVRVAFISAGTIFWQSDAHYLCTT